MRTTLRSTSLLPALALAVAAGFAPAAPAEAGKAIFTLEDPRGDDHGDGGLVYPLAHDFEAGDLDLISFSARRDGDGTLFEAVFARPIRKPEREAIDQLGTQLSDVARLGFYTFNVDVYIDTDRVAGSGGVVMLPGRKAEVDPAFAWDRAVVLTPRPTQAESELRRLLSRTLRKASAKEETAAGEAELDALREQVPEDVEKRFHFPSRVRVTGPKVSFYVPGSFLGGPADPSWAYVVVVSGADIRQSFDLGSTVGYGETTRDRLMILPRGDGTRTDRFGGGDPRAEPFQTPLVDVLVPAGQSQERLLSDYDRHAGRPARLPGVVPAAPPAAPAAEPADPAERDAT